METDDAGAESADDVDPERVSEHSGLQEDSEMSGVDEPADTHGAAGEEVVDSKEDKSCERSDMEVMGEDAAIGSSELVRSAEGGGEVVGSRDPGVENKEKGTKLLSREELIELFHAVSPVARGNLTTVGMVSLSACMYLVRSADTAGRLP